MAERHTKLARLQSLRDRLPFLSHSALHAILSIAKNEQLPEISSRRDLRQARDEISTILTPYGTICQTVNLRRSDGSDLAIDIQNPFAMLHHACSHSPQLSALIRRCVDKQQPSLAKPWNIVLYADEVTPGNQLAYLQGRKFWAIYWSVLEWGPLVLADEDMRRIDHIDGRLISPWERIQSKDAITCCCFVSMASTMLQHRYRFASEEAWFELVFLRSEETNGLAGGFSGLLARMLLVFFGQEGPNMQMSGIGLTMSDGSYQHLVMHLGCFLADEAALHLGYCCKGASGLKCCLLCANIFNYKVRRDIVELDATGIAQHHTTHDASKLKLHTPASITAILRQLQNSHGTISKRAFEELETTLGWNYSPHGVLWNPIAKPHIEPSEKATFDWMHIIFVHGIFGVHMGQVMWRLKEEGVSYAKIHEFLQTLSWPRQHGKNCGKDTCIPKRARSCWDSVVFKCTASEGLSLIPILARYFTEFMHRDPAPSAVAKGVAANFLQLVFVVHLILRSARFKVAPATLQQAIGDYLRGFSQLFGQEVMVIKFHLLIHLPAHLKKYGFLPNCFVHERKHKESKTYANSNTNTASSWGRSLLRDVTCHHLSVLQDATRFSSGVALLQPYTPRAALEAALHGQFGPGTYMMSNSARLRYGDQVAVGDVVLYRDGGNAHAGKIGMLVSADVQGELILAAALEGFTHEHTTYGNSVWKPTGLMQVCLLSSIEAPCVWCTRSDGNVFTLRPAWME